MDPDLFFSLRGEAGDLAVATCASCPVREERSAYALAQPEHFGVWGGLSESERKRMHKAARRQP